jgi:hypothetical protein
LTTYGKRGQTDARRIEQLQAIAGYCQSGCVRERISKRTLARATDSRMAGDERDD